MAQYVNPPSPSALARASFYVATACTLGLRCFLLPSCYRPTLLFLSPSRFPSPPVLPLVSLPLASVPLSLAVCVCCRWLARKGFNLLTGGGRGVMQASSKAFVSVRKRHGRSIGIVRSSDDNRTPFVRDYHALLGDGEADRRRMLEEEWATCSSCWCVSLRAHV